MKYRLVWWKTSGPVRKIVGEVVLPDNSKLLKLSGIDASKDGVFEIQREAIHGMGVISFKGELAAFGLVWLPGAFRYAVQCVDAPLEATFEESLAGSAEVPPADE